MARHLGHRLAITAEGTTLSYDAFEDTVTRIAGGLRTRHGLKTGARVAILMDNCAAYLPALFGIWRAGMAAVPINSKLHPKEVAWILKNSEAALVLASEQHAEALTSLQASLPPIVVTGTSDWQRLAQSEPAPLLPSDPHAEAWIFYTSGTTGRPKGAV